PYIEAMTDTLVAIFSARDPKFQGVLRDPTNLPENQQVSAVERLIQAIYTTLDTPRDTPIGEDSAESIFHRGKLIYKVVYLPADQRGEKREPLDELDFQMADQVPLDQTRIVTEG